MGKQVKLLPCPFCGSEAELQDAVRIEPNWWCGAIMCTGVYNNKCSVQMVFGGGTKEEAVAGAVRAWNTRTDD